MTKPSALEEYVNSENLKVARAIETAYSRGEKAGYERARKELLGDGKKDGWALLSETGGVLNFFFDEDEAKDHLEEFPKQLDDWRIVPVKLVRVGDE